MKVYEISDANEIETILDSVNYDYTIDFTESLTLSSILIQAAEKRNKFNFVFEYSG